MSLNSDPVQDNYEHNLTRNSSIRLGDVLITQYSSRWGGCTQALIDPAPPAKMALVSSASATLAFTHNLELHIRVHTVVFERPGHV